jgi:hypothetical protein
MNVKISKIPTATPLLYHNGKRWVKGEYWFHSLKGDIVHVFYLMDNPWGTGKKKEIIYVHKELFAKCFRIDQYALKGGNQPHAKTLSS